MTLTTDPNPNPNPYPDPNPNPNQVQNAESSLSVGFTSLRDGKALWLMLTPKDGGIMQARTESTWACGGWAEGRACGTAFRRC